MKLTNKQIIGIGKDRAIDELIDIVNAAHGYPNLDELQRQRVKMIGELINLPETLVESIKSLEKDGFITIGELIDLPETLVESIRSLEKSGFINDEEVILYNKNQ